jgi:hypothetical protein
VRGARRRSGDQELAREVSGGGGRLRPDVATAVEAPPGARAQQCTSTDRQKGFISDSYSSRSFLGIESGV